MAFLAALGGSGTAASVGGSMLANEATKQPQQSGPGVQQGQAAPLTAPTAGAYANRFAPNPITGQSASPMTPDFMSQAMPVAKAGMSEQDAGLLGMIGNLFKNQK